MTCFCRESPVPRLIRCTETCEKKTYIHSDVCRKLKLLVAIGKRQVVSKTSRIPGVVMFNKIKEKCVLFLTERASGVLVVIAMYSMSGIRDIMSRSLKYLCGKKTFRASIRLQKWSFTLVRFTLPRWSQNPKRRNERLVQDSVEVFILIMHL